MDPPLFYVMKVCSIIFRKIGLKPTLTNIAWRKDDNPTSDIRWNYVYGWLWPTRSQTLTEPIVWVPKMATYFFNVSNPVSNIVEWFFINIATYFFNISNPVSNIVEWFFICDVVDEHDSLCREEENLNYQVPGPTHIHVP